MRKAVRVWVVNEEVMNQIIVVMDVFSKVTSSKLKKLI